jgi:hypothetical protein
MSLIFKDNQDIIKQKTREIDVYIKEGSLLTEYSECHNNVGVTNNSIATFKLESQVYFKLERGTHITSKNGFSNYLVLDSFDEDKLPRIVTSYHSGGYISKRTIYSIDESDIPRVIKDRQIIDIPVSTKITLLDSGVTVPVQEPIKGILANCVEIIIPKGSYLLTFDPNIPPCIKSQSGVQSYVQQINKDTKFKLVYGQKIKNFSINN